MNSSTDHLIIGGGIIGLTTAYFLAKAGQRVMLLDRGELGREASWAGAGIIPPGQLAHATTPLDQLRARSVALLPGLTVELRQLTGLETGYRVCGGLEYLSPADEYAVELWRAEGLAFERLSPQQLREREPALAPPADATVYDLPGFAQVRNPWHLRALWQACDKLGVIVRPHTPALGWRTDGQRIIGVTLPDGELQARQFLLCAGAWSGELTRSLGLSLAIHPVKGQIVLFNPGRVLFQRIVMEGKRYLVPRADGRVLAGSTEEPEAGFHKEPTREGLAELLAFSQRLVPALEASLVETSWAGLRPGSADGLPTIGRVPGWENLLLAAGHYRAGVQLSVATGLGLSEAALSGTMPDWLEPFRWDRPREQTHRPAFRS